MMIVVSDERSGHIASHHVVVAYDVVACACLLNTDKIVYLYSAVSVGDCIMTVSGREKVAAVETMSGEGVYTLVTNGEFIVVNGIIASPFGGNHMIANLYYNVHRLIYMSYPALLKLSWLHQANEVMYDWHTIVAQ
jgi:hypothetical protein